MSSALSSTSFPSLSSSSPSLCSSGKEISASKRFKKNIVHPIFRSSDMPSVICSFLDIQEMHQAFLVCKAFNRAKDATIKNLAKRITHLNDEDVLRYAPVFKIFPTPAQLVNDSFPHALQVARLMNKLPNLTGISLTDKIVSNPSMLFGQIEGSHPNLTSLSFFNEDDLSMQDIELILSRYPRLQHLAVDGEQVTHFNWLIPLLPQLQSLTCSFQSVEDIGTFDPILEKGLPELTKLDIEDVRWETAEAFLLKFIKACPKLRELILTRYETAPSTVKQLLIAAPDIQLQVYFINPNSEQLRELATAGENLSRISGLRIHDLTICEDEVESDEEDEDGPICEDEAFRSLFSATPPLLSSTLTNLNRLDLSAVSLPSATLRFLTGHIQNLRELRFDGLSNSSNSNDFSESIAQFIAANPNLQTLVLISEKNVPSIFKSLNCPALRKLNISYNNINDEGLATIAKACPNLTHLDLLELRKLTIKGIRNLAALCPGLQYVYFSPGKKGMALANELHRLLPSCKADIRLEDEI